MSLPVKIGNYRFERNLGNGTFGKVKLAVNEITNHKVAIKILNKRKIKLQGVFEKVKREIKVLRRFNHPHIIKHFEFIDTSSDIFIVLEYAEKGELFDLIQRKEKLAETEARRIFQQIISAIEYSHLHKMVHRDLKPENLLLDKDHNIKLIDFGLANSTKDSVALSTACGSPNYAAPEVISGQSYSGQEVDIWSCGVILYAMICGSLPFDDEQLAILFMKIKQGNYRMPAEIPPDCKDLIRRMLQTNPVKRIKLSEIKQHRWYLQDLPRYLEELAKAPLKNENVIDKDLVRHLMNIDRRISKTFEEVCQDILDKKSVEYVGAYELMKHDKMKRQCFTGPQSQHQQVTTNSQQLPQQRQFYSIDNPLSWPATQAVHSLNNQSQSQRPLVMTQPGQYQHFNQPAAAMGSTPSKYVSKYQLDRLKRFKTRYNTAYSQVRQPMISCSTSMVSGQRSRRAAHPAGAPIMLQPALNNFMTEASERKTSPPKDETHSGRTAQPYFHKQDMEIESGYPSESDAQATALNKYERPVPGYDPVNDSKLSYSTQHLAKVKAPQEARFRIFHSTGFQGNPNDALDLICLTLRSLDFDWQVPKSKDNKLKCRIRLEKEPLLNDDKVIQDFLTRKFLRFNICILKEPNKAEGKSRGSNMRGSSNAANNEANKPDRKGETQEISRSATNYNINVQLVKGTPLVFLDFTQNFFNMIETRIEMQRLKVQQYQRDQKLDNYEHAMDDGDQPPREYQLVLIK